MEKRTYIFYIHRACANKWTWTFSAVQEKKKSQFVWIAEIKQNLAQRRELIQRVVCVCVCVCVCVVCSKKKKLWRAPSTKKTPHIFKCECVCDFRFSLVC